MIKEKPGKKLLALMLSVLLIISAIPMGIISAMAAEVFTMSIVDENDQAVSGADVTFVTKVNDVETDIIADESQKSDSNGLVSLSEIDDYLKANPEQSISIEYSVSASDFETKSAAYLVDATNVGTGLKVSIVSYPTVSVTGGDEGTHIEVGGTDVGTSKKVSKGTEVYVIVAKKANCLISLNKTAKSVNDNKYTFDVEDDLAIEVTYTPITYTVDVEVENGEVQPSQDGKITVVKTNEETELTLTPDEHYELCELKLGNDNIDIEKDVIHNEDGTYTYNLKSNDINDNNTKLIAKFTLKNYKVSYTVNNTNGNVTCEEYEFDNNKSISVPAKAKIKVSISANSGYAISSVVVDGVQKFEDVFESGKLELEVLKDTTIDVSFDKIDVDTLANIKDIKQAFEIEGYDCKDEANNTYYINGKNDKGEVDKKEAVKISNKSQISDGNNTIVENIVKIDVYSSKDKTFKSGFSVGVNDNLNPLQVISNPSLGKYKTYLVPGTIKIRLDNLSPEIKTTKKTDSDYTNKAQKIDFTVTDPVQTYNNEDYASGIKDVAVTRSYGKDLNQTVTCSEENGVYSFSAEPVEGFNGKVTYTITATDNVGNSSSESFDIENDTVAPELSNVDFSVKNNSVFSRVFARVINKISFGKWFEKKIVATVSATDAGSGFGNDTSVASIKLVTENANVDDIIPFTAAFDKDGKAEVEISSEDVFKGTIYYQISDKLGNTTEYELLTKEKSNIGDGFDYVMIEENKPTTNIKLNSDYSASSKFYQKDENTLIANSDPKLDITFEDGDSGLYGYSIEVKGKDENATENKANDLSLNIETDAPKTEKAGTLKSYLYNLDLSTIEADEKGKYVITAKAIDNSGNVSDENIYTIYKDKTEPKIDKFSFSVGDSSTTDLSAVEVTHYGFYFKKTVNVTITAKDVAGESEAASGVNSIIYKAVDIDGTTKYSGTEKVDSNNQISFKIDKDFKGQIYAKAMDNVENTTSDFVHPDGSIIESSAKHSESSSIVFNAPTSKRTENDKYSFKYEGEAQKDKSMDFDNASNVPLYNNDVSFGVKVSDTYSGIREVTYTVFEGSKSSKKTVKIDNLGAFEEKKNEGWTITKDKNDSNLVTEMTNTIAVSGNYNDMVLLIELTDRAGNQSYDYYVFGIDKTAPSITVTYDNNNSDNQSGTGDYFKENRTATILVQERNFNTENVKFTLKNKEGAVPKVIDKKLVAEDKDGNGDGNIYKYVIAYNANGVYSFNVEYTDRATNKATVDYKDSVAPKGFTLDKTMPTINVSYDNNEAQNEKFFKAHRTATITIVEHNFDVNRVTITQTSSISGNAISNPSVSWLNNGDTHIGTINYNDDGDYTFDITMTDKANNIEKNVNYGSSVAAKDFTVDTTYSNLVKVDGIANKGVLGLSNGNINDDAKISITINDVNLDNYNVKLTRSRVLVTGESDETENASQKNVLANPSKQCAENNVDVTAKFVKNASGSANAAATISIPKKSDGVKNDGLYTLTIEAKDRAGNAYDTNANIITFSVNRFGSVFTFSQDLYKLLNDNDGYTKSVDSKNLSVYEYNATSINAQSVEVIANNDSKMLAKSSEYLVSKDTKQNDTSWSKYTYNIKPENFKNDGVYTLRVSSKDAASITSQTIDYEVCSATFRVDSTPADVISVNYSTDVNKMSFSDAGSAKTDALTVDFTVEDLIRLEKVEVYVNDELQNTYVYGKDFDDANSFSGGKFTISDGGSNEQSFRIVATDKAGNVIDTSNKQEYKPGYVFFDHIVVTANTFAQFYANKTMFFGSIGGVVVVAAGIWLIVALKNKKKKEE